MTGFEARRLAQRGTCLNTCRHANDGECDDGRENAHTELCDHGSDCADCGPAGTPFRRGRSATRMTSMTSMTTMDTAMDTTMMDVATAMGGACTNTCQYANDNECDDGRPNAHTSVCGAGTDCADCGPVGRAYTRPTAATMMGTAMAGACTNTCQHANDNECDDGRPNAHTSVCASGTDCADCGPVGRAFSR